MSGKAARVVIAFFLLGTSAYCSLECNLSPCQELRHDAEATPPCHQHSQQPVKEVPAKNCAHLQFVAEHSSAQPHLLSMPLLDWAEILPVDLVIPPPVVAAYRAVWNSPLPGSRPIDRSTVLRI